MLLCGSAVCRASDWGLRLAGIHPADVSLSKVLHHYLLQGTADMVVTVELP